MYLYIYVFFYLSIGFDLQSLVIYYMFGFIIEG